MSVARRRRDDVERCRERLPPARRELAPSQRAHLGGAVERDPQLADDERAGRHGGRVAGHEVAARQSCDEDRERAQRRARRREQDAVLAQPDVAAGSERQLDRPARLVQRPPRAGPMTTARIERRAAGPMTTARVERCAAGPMTTARIARRAAVAVAVMAPSRPVELGREGDRRGPKRLDRLVGDAGADLADAV